MCFSPDFTCLNVWSSRSWKPTLLVIIGTIGGTGDHSASVTVLGHQEASEGEGDLSGTPRVSAGCRAPAHSPAGGLPPPLPSGTGVTRPEATRDTRGTVTVARCKSLWASRTSLSLGTCSLEGGALEAQLWPQGAFGAGKGQGCVDPFRAPFQMSHAVQGIFSWRRTRHVAQQK